MNLAISSLDSLRRPLTAAQPAQGVFPNALTEEKGRRDVVRCQQCFLVQFRTASGGCRRCEKPLPLKFVVYEAVRSEAESPEPMDGSIPAESPAPFDPTLSRRDYARVLRLENKVRAWRRRRGYSQEQLAALLNIPRTYISRIENARVLPGPRLISRIATALGIGISELLEGNSKASGNSASPVCAADLLLESISRLATREILTVLAVARRMIEERAMVPSR